MRSNRFGAGARVRYGLDMDEEELVARVTERMMSAAALAFIQGDPDVRLAILRREGQKVPRNSNEAAPAFGCMAYGIELRGVACGLRHTEAKKTMAKESAACIGCPAGIARARILGVVDRPPQAMQCKRPRCISRAQNVGPLGEFCAACVDYGMYGRGLPVDAGLDARREDARRYLSETPIQCRPSAKAIDPAAPECAREACHRRSVGGGGILGPFCHQCIQWAAAVLRKDGINKPTAEQRRDLMASRPLQRPGEWNRNVAPVVAAPPAVVVPSCVRNGCDRPPIGGTFAGYCDFCVKAARFNTRAVTGDRRAAMWHWLWARPNLEKRKVSN